MSRRDPLVHIRMTEEMKSYLMSNAGKNCRSFNSEIVFGLKVYVQTIEATKKASDQPGSNSDASHSE